MPAQNPKIALLAVDDERMVLSALKEQLRRNLGSHVMVEVAESGEEAVEVFDELSGAGHAVPLVISDQLMPGMRGDALLAIIHAKSPRTRTVLLTGQATAAEIGAAVNHAGLYRFLAKPWREDELLFTVREALRLHDLESTVEDREVEARAARAASEAKGTFLAHMSHELRTPLNAVIGMTELLARTDLDARQRRYVEVASSCADTLLSLINDVLDLSKIEAGKLTLDRVDFDLHDQIDATVAMLAGQGERKGLAVSHAIARDVPRWVHGDPGRLRQILVNLVGNAIKFTDAGTVQVSAGSPRAIGAGTEVRFEVRDTGIGVPQEARARLFEAFAQVDSVRHKRTGGTGLGTTIACELSRAMDGAIGLESEVGGGSTFWFTARFGPATTKAQVGVRSTSAEGPLGLRVLLVEDNPINQEVAGDMLRLLGCSVVMAEHGGAALDVLQARRPELDVVLMDCRMPVLDGYAATRAVRASETPSERVPIIGLSADALAESRQLATDAGMDGYVTKPVTVERLRGALAPFARASATPLPSGATSPPSSAAGPALDSVVRGKKRVLELLVAHLPAQIAALTRALSGRDARELALAAHSLRGGAAMCGLADLADRAASVESSAHEGAVEKGEVAATVALAERVLAEARDALAT
jgi:signal transduction histidine kinase/HPt (histidine-containing phosphotransfer) domain-containing protein